MIGRKLLHYEIAERLGAGGMGEVWRAIDPRLEREVAIKVLPVRGGEESREHERFVREARATSALVHPNIITIHEINAADGLDFIVMEYVRGEPLSQALVRGPLTVARAVEYAIQIADALKVAHEAGIVHRDLKPANIMISSSGLVKVVDFGIAKRVALEGDEDGRTTSAPLTAMGVSIGTPTYMSPEQALGDAVDSRSDLFSFGIVLYEMLAGQRPFESTTRLSLVRQIVHDPPRPLRAVAPHVPSALVTIVDRCLVKDPAGRYVSAATLLAELRRVAAQLPSKEADPSEAETHLSAAAAAVAPRRTMPLRAIAIAAAVVLVVIVAWARGPSLLQWLRTGPSPTQQELYNDATERLRFYYREGNVDAAIKQLDRALALKSPYPIAEARLSAAYWRKNFLSADPEWQKRALAHAERAVAGNDQLAVAHIARGTALMLAGRVDEAATAYQKAETLEPGELGAAMPPRRSRGRAKGLGRRGTAFSTRDGVRAAGMGGARISGHVLVRG